MELPMTEVFPKSTFSEADVERERLLRLTIHGVIGSTISDGGDRWILTTILPVAGGAPAASPAAPQPLPSPTDGGGPAPAAGAGGPFTSLVPGGFFSATPDDHAVPRSIRTNNPGALNISDWQRRRAGFAGVTESDRAGNRTTIYRTPEHGVAAWFHLLSVIYGLGSKTSFRIGELARRYAGTESGPAVDGYIAGWRAGSRGTIGEQTDLSLADDGQTLNLARTMFRHEAGRDSPLHDDQIGFAVRRERDGTLPA